MNITKPLDRRRRRNIFSFNKLIISDTIGGLPPSANSYDIRGTITGPVVEGVTVYVLNSATRQIVASGISDTLGNYSILNLPIEVSYDILPMIAYHTFSPHLSVATLTNTDIVLNFTSIPDSQYLFDGTTVSIVDEDNNRLWEDIAGLYVVLFSTESQDTVTPTVTTSDSSLVDWDWEDGSQTLSNNTPTHTYTDLLPSHDISISGTNPLNVTIINLASDNVTSVNLSAFPNTSNLTVNNNPNLTALDISGLTDLEFLTTFNTSAGASLDFTGLSSVISFRSWNSGLTDSALATLTSPALDTLIVRSNPITTINLTPFTVLDRLQCWNCSLVGALDISSNINLTELGVYNNPSLGALDISNNTLLDDFDIRNTGRTSGEIDQYLIDLDSNGVVNGYFDYSENPGSPTTASATAYLNLVSKGWTLTGVSPLQEFELGIVTAVDPTINVSADTTPTGGSFEYRWGDSNVTVATGSTLTQTEYTYTDGLASHTLSLSISDPQDLTYIKLQNAFLTSFSSPNFPNLDHLQLGQNYNLTSLDVSSYPLLTYLNIANTAITSISIANNPLLDDVRVQNSVTDVSSLDNIIIALDANGVTNGILIYDITPSSASYNAYNNLAAKGWAVTGTSPPSPEIYLTDPFFGFYGPFAERYEIFDDNNDSLGIVEYGPTASRDNQPHEGWEDISLNPPADAIHISYEPTRPGDYYLYLNLSGPVEQCSFYSWISGVDPSQGFNFYDETTSFPKYKAIPVT